MSRLDALPADQRAVLQLLLKQGKGYDELAGLLRTDATAVRARAADALDGLGPRDGTPLPPDRQAELADFLLGQQSASQRQATRSYLEGSASGRAWARTVSGELRASGLATSESLPDIPAGGVEEVDEAYDALAARTERRAEAQRSSRIGGVLLLVGLGLVLALVIVWAVAGDDDDEQAASTTPATQTQPATTGQPTVEQAINLNPPEGSDSRARGLVNILRQGDQRAIAFQAQRLERSREGRAYAVWLRNPGRNARGLGFTPAVGEDGRLQFVSELPRDASRFSQFVLTVESARRPTKPGPVVLQGDLGR